MAADPETQHPISEAHLQAPFAMPQDQVPTFSNPNSSQTPSSSNSDHESSSQPEYSSSSSVTATGERVKAAKRAWFQSEKGRAAVKRRLEKQRQATKDAREAKARSLKEASTSEIERMREEEQRKKESRKEKNRLYQARFRAKHLGYKSKKYPDLQGPPPAAD